MEILTAFAAACPDMMLLRSLQFDTQTLPGVACFLVGVFLLLLASGVIGGAAESEERKAWQQRRRLRFLLLGIALLGFGGYLFLQAYGVFA